MNNFGGALEGLYSVILTFPGYPIFSKIIHIYQKKSLESALIDVRVH